MSVGIHLGLHIIRDLLPVVLPDKKFNIRQARVLLGAIGLQESQFEVRRQYGGGPAASFWQFEITGIRGVLRHHASREYARDVMLELDVAPRATAVWCRMLTDDMLGVAFARLLLYTDPRPLPSIGAMQAAWLYYVHNWRPGRPRPELWEQNYRLAAKHIT